MVPVESPYPKRAKREDGDVGGGGGCCGCGGQFCRQFCALVRKNALTKRRAKCQLVRETSLPLPRASCVLAVVAAMPGWLMF